eukprot:2161741-Rhodomonas_salina.4
MASASADRLPGTAAPPHRLPLARRLDARYVSTRHRTASAEPDSVAHYLARAAVGWRGCLGAAWPTSVGRRTAKAGEFGLPSHEDAPGGSVPSASWQHYRRQYRPSQSKCRRRYLAARRRGITVAGW